jgi:hypothetical protein
MSAFPSCDTRPVINGIHKVTLQECRRFALSLPETTEEPHHELSSFRVRGKIFATVPTDGLHLNIFVDEHQREAAMALVPTACEKLWWGPKVRGLRVRLAEAPPDFVFGLLYSAWRSKAPQPLADSSVNPLS